MSNDLKTEIRDQIIFIVCFIAVWWIVAEMGIVNEKLFPTPGEIGHAFLTAFTENGMLSFVGYSLGLIVKGLVIGIGLAFLCSSPASITFFTVSFMAFFSSFSDSTGTRV